MVFNESDTVLKIPNETALIVDEKDLYKKYLEDKKW